VYCGVGRRACTRAATKHDARLAPCVFRGLNEMELASCSPKCAKLLAALRGRTVSVYVCKYTACVLHVCVYRHTQYSYRSMNFEAVMRECHKSHCDCETKVLVPSRYVQEYLYVYISIYRCMQVGGIFDHTQSRFYAAISAAATATDFVGRCV